MALTESHYEVADARQAPPIIDHLVGVGVHVDSVVDGVGIVDDGERQVLGHLVFLSGLRVHWLTRPSTGCATLTELTEYCAIGTVLSVL